jgi:hypothetical protein
MHETLFYLVSWKKFLLPPFLYYQTQLKQGYQNFGVTVPLYRQTKSSCNHKLNVAQLVFGLHLPLDEAEFARSDPAQSLDHIGARCRAHPLGNELLGNMNCGEYWNFFI